MDPITLGLAGASMASGIAGAHNEDKAFHAARSRAWQQLRYGRNLGQGYMQQGQDALQQAIEMIRGSKSQALGEISRMGHSSRQGVLDRETQRTSEMGAGLASRGLGNTTVGANMRRGIAADTDRALADINEGLAGLSAGTIGQFAGMEAGAMSDFSRFMAGRADWLMGAQQSIADVGLGFQQQSGGPQDFSGLSSMMGQGGGFNWDDLVSMFSQGGIPGAGANNDIPGAS